MDNLRDYIKSKKPDIDDRSLYYFTNYFSYINKNGLIPDGVDFDEILDNALRFSKIVFYREGDPICSKIGNSAKGVRWPEDNTLYVRDSLDDELKEMVIYHEIHHAAQTNKETNQVGIQTDNFGRLIMEAQTEYLAERVYSSVHGIQFEERDIPSEQLRMMSGGTVRSSLHSYEHYDNLLTKLAIMLGVDKDYFVSINFLNDGRGIKDLENRINKLINEYDFNFTFLDLLYSLDYIYCVDCEIYLEGDNKDLLLSLEESRGKYLIYNIDGRELGETLSLVKQKKFLDVFDLDFATFLSKSGGDFELLRYIVDDNNRESLKQIFQRG